MKTALLHHAHQVACEVSLKPDVRQSDIWRLFMARTYFYFLMGGQIESVPGRPNPAPAGCCPEIIATVKVEWTEEVE